MRNRPRVRVRALRKVEKTNRKRLRHRHHHGAHRSRRLLRKVQKEVTPRISNLNFEISNALLANSQWSSRRGATPRQGSIPFPKTLPVNRARNAPPKSVPKRISAPPRYRAQSARAARRALKTSVRRESSHASELPSPRPRHSR